MYTIAIGVSFRITTTSVYIVRRCPLLNASLFPFFLAEIDCFHLLLLSFRERDKRKLYSFEFIQICWCLRSHIFCRGMFSIIIMDSLYVLHAICLIVLCYFDFDSLILVIFTKPCIPIQAIDRQPDRHS